MAWRDMDCLGVVNVFTEFGFCV